MKITCTKKEDLIKERDAYFADKEARQAKYDEQQGRYAEASQKEFDAVENAIRSAIGDTFVQYDVRVERALSFRDVREDSLAELEVYLSSERDVHSQPFSWTWRARLSDGELKKESSSWSGMDVTTEEDVAYMREVVRILEVLINIDWSTLLLRDMPRYKDYITDRDPRYESIPKDFNREIKDADIEDAAGKDVLFEGTHFDSDSRRKIWYKIVKVTPSQVQVIRVPDSYVQQAPNIVREFVENRPYIERVSKDRLYPKINTESTYEY